MVPSFGLIRDAAPRRIPRTGFVLSSPKPVPCDWLIICHLCAQINASILANCSVHVIEIFAWISMVQDTSLSLLFYTDVDSAAIISFKLEKTPKPVRVSFFTSTPSNILTYDKLANNSIYNLSAEQKNAHSNQQYQAPSQSPRVYYKNSEDPQPNYCRTWDRIYDQHFWC